MNKKLKYAIIFAVVIAVVLSITALMLINPRSETNELLKEFNTNLETGATTGQIVGQLNKGDELKIYGNLTGDPVDFFITRYFSNVSTHLEVVRWKFTSSNIGDIFWQIPEKGEYMLNLQAQGNHSEIHVFVYRKYIKPLFPW